MPAPSTTAALLAAFAAGPGALVGLPMEEAESALRRTSSCEQRHFEPVGCTMLHCCGGWSAPKVEATCGVMRSDRVRWTVSLFEERGQVVEVAAVPDVSVVVEEAEPAPVETRLTDGRRVVAPGGAGQTAWLDPDGVIGHLRAVETDAFEAHRECSRAEPRAVEVEVEARPGRRILGTINDVGGR